MTILTLNDLDASEALDHKAMAALKGGHPFVDMYLEYFNRDFRKEAAINAAVNSIIQGMVPL
jgi:hypothetical protein